MLPIVSKLKKIAALVDTGSAVTLLHSSLLWLCDSIAELDASSFPNLVSASGDPLELTARGYITMTFPDTAGSKLQFPVLIGLNIPFDMILGQDFLQATSAIIDVNAQMYTLSLSDNRVSCPMSPPSKGGPLTGSVLHNTSLNARAHTAVCISVVADSMGVYELVPRAEFLDKHAGILIPRSLHTLHVGANHVCIPILNASLDSSTLYERTQLVDATFLPPADVITCVNAVATFDPTRTVPGAFDDSVLDEIIDAGSVLDSTLPSREELYKMISPDLSDADKDVIYRVLFGLIRVFANHPDRVDAAYDVEHRVKTVPGARPARQRPYPLNPALTAVQVTEINKLLAAGIITPSTSSWSAPAIMVKKPDSSYRMCIDYRRLNNLTEKDVYPLPRINDMLHSLNGARYMSTVDLRKGFYQVPVAESDRHLTAFSTTWGHFEFTRMPFGLTNAPATFQRFMDAVLSGMVPFICMVYIDDIFIYSRSIEDHVRDLTRVLQAIDNANLHLNPAKCHFGFSELKFLGHIVGRDGLRPNPDTVQSVLEFPQPTSRTEVQRFLGMANYYRGFIKNFSDIAEPLNRLTRGGQGSKFVFTDECVQSLEALKAALTRAPVLGYADYGKPFILRTDASLTGWGAVLQQPYSDDPTGARVVIAYASRTLTPAERNYSATEREALAVVSAIKHFRIYLTATKFTIETDHAALSSLFDSKSKSGRIERWSLFLQEYDYVIRHRPGSAMRDADFLSRAPLPVAPIIAPVSPILQHQRDDPFIAAVRAYLETGQLAPNAEMNLNAEVVALAANCAVVDDLVCLVQHKAGVNMTPRALLPASLRDDVLQRAHASPTGGHLGLDKIFGALSAKYYWRSMYRDIEAFIQACPVCDLTRKTAASAAPLQPFSSSSPFDFIATDIAGPLPTTSRGNSYIVVFVDLFTKWAEAFPIAHADASTVATLLVNNVALRFGPPSRLLSDQGSTYTGTLARKVAELLKIKQIFTSAYHPQTNGQAERFNKTIKQMLLKFVDTNQSDWDLFLASIVFAYNTMPHATTGVSPYFLVFGQHPHTPLDRMLGLPDLAGTPANIASYIRRQREALLGAHELARTAIESAAARSKDRVDASREFTSFKVGDSVYLHVPHVAKGMSRKLTSPWRGPYLIKARLSDSLYELQGGNRPVNVARLKLASIPAQVDPTDSIELIE